MEEKGSILIVDDNVSLCKTMAMVLTRKGYTVVTAKDGFEAIEKVDERPVDMIFMDIKMPLMNGVESFKRTRPEAVVVMMTAYLVEELVQEALQEGAYGIIYKPLDIERVIALIESAKQAKKGALVMVVDDDPGTRVTLKNILIKRGYEVGIACTGEEAVAEAQERVHDIIFIDVKLPTINGLETYLAIREVNPEAAAVMITGYRQEVAGLVEEALQNNAYACFHKPLDMEDVLKLVDEVWKRKRKGG